MEENGIELSKTILEVSDFNNQDNANNNIKTKSINNKLTESNYDKLLNSNNNESPKYYFYKKLGNSFSFFGNRNGDPLFIIGPNWRLYICFSISVSGLYIFLLGTFWNFINLTPKVIGIIIYLIFYLSYTYTFLINPGFPKNNLEIKKGESRNKFKYCKICKILVHKENNTFHCDICDICIEEYDHHCVWTSKCIGKNNICSFNIFAIFSFISIIYAMVILYLVKFSFLHLEK